MKLDTPGRRRTLRRATRRLWLARYWQAQGDLREAAGYACQAFGLVRAHPAPPIELAVGIALTTARVERDCEHPAASLASLNWAVELLEGTSVSSLRRHLLGRALVDLGDCHRRAGRYPSAREALQRAQELMEIDELAESVHLAELMTILGIVAKETGDYDQAAHWYAKVGRVLDETGDLAYVASLQHNLAGLAHIQERYARAEAHARQAVALRQKAAGANEVDIAADIAVLAAAVAGQERYAEARELFVQAMRICHRASPPRLYEVAVHLHNLAAIDQATGRPAQAEEGYRHSIALKEELLGPGHPEVGLLANNLGTLLSDQNRQVEAAECFRRALAITEAGLPSDHPTIVAIRHNLDSASE